MFPDNKAVQPCLAPQTDIRRAISFNSPAALAKFAEHRKPTCPASNTTACKGP